MRASYTEDELARLAGTGVDRVRGMARLGILSPDEDGVYRPPDIQRVRIAEAFDRSGIELEQIGRMIADGTYSTGWADLLFPEPIPMAGSTLAEAAAGLGLPLELVHRAYVVGWALPSPADGDEVREDDMEMLRMLGLMFHALGGDHDATMSAIRYLGENIRRLAESQMRYFRETFEEPMIAANDSQREVMDRITQIGAPMVPLGYRAVELLHRRHLESYQVEDIVTNTEIAMARAGLQARSDPNAPALSFVDLTGYTHMTEQEGDAAAARLADRFSELTTHTADHHGGRVVKLLGDGAMFHFPDPAAAARCALDLVREIPAAGLPTAHVGIDVGNVVFRDGDYFGRTVNLAARVAARAQPGEVLGTLSAKEASERGGVAWGSAGEVELKGIAGPVQLFRALEA